jgi:hypothetical protein
METLKVTKKIIIGIILMFIGTIMIISSFFIPDNSAQCTKIITPIVLFTSSLIIFGIGILLFMIGLAMINIEYRKQTKWVIKRRHKR